MTELDIHKKNINKVIELIAKDKEIPLELKVYLEENELTYLYTEDTKCN